MNKKTVLEKIGKEVLSKVDKIDDVQTLIIFGYDNDEGGNSTKVFLYGDKLWLSNALETEIMAGTNLGLSIEVAYMVAQKFKHTHENCLRLERDTDGQYNVHTRCPSERHNNCQGLDCNVQINPNEGTIH